MATTQSPSAVSIELLQVTVAMWILCYMRPTSGALNFHLGIGVQPKGPNKGARELTTAEFGTLEN